ncbi:MAG: hypothetical protein CMN58_03975 [Solibacterales bacterium]|nr:hypothetical protein [Bryobacterales bacterium]
MPPHLFFTVTTLCIAVQFMATSLAAQGIVSAVGGMVYYAESDIFIDDKPVKFDSIRRPHLKKGQKLHTEMGRAEVMIVYDGFARLAPYSDIELISVGSDSARMRLHKGAVMVALTEVWDKDSVAMLVGDHEVKFHKGGVYRLEASGVTPATVKVFKGKVSIVFNGSEKTVKSKRKIDLGNGPYVAVKFDHKNVDDFRAWHRTRMDIINKEREAAIAAVRKGEGDRADHILLKGGSGPQFGDVGIPGGFGGYGSVGRGAAVPSSGCCAGGAGGR